MKTPNIVLSMYLFIQSIYLSIYRGKDTIDHWDQKRGTYCQLDSPIHQIIAHRLHSLEPLQFPSSILLHIGLNIITTSQSTNKYPNHFLKTIGWRGGGFDWDYHCQEQQVGDLHCLL